MEGCDINRRTNDGVTAMDLANAARSISVLQLLISHIGKSEGQQEEECVNLVSTLQFSMIEMAFSDEPVSSTENQVIMPPLVPFMTM